MGPLALRSWASFKKTPDFKSFEKIEKCGVAFHSPFGTAGGLDKTAQDLLTWTKFGAGFLEIGTFTPKPQGPNPGKIIDRNNKAMALWNCMGFPNAGFENALTKVENFKKKHSTHPPLFVNIGKNRTTDLEKAHLDYINGLKFFKDVADFFVINISSPNTKGLRKLHEKENFKAFVEPILNEASKLKAAPVLLKLSPDLDDSLFKDFLSNAEALPLAGYSLTNTTVSRPENLSFPARGGLSGEPLKQISRHKLLVARKHLDEMKSKKLLVSLGGVMSPEEAHKRLLLGADLVQFYSGLVFYGPSLFADSFKRLKLN